MGKTKFKIMSFCLFLAAAFLFVQGVSAVTVYSGDTVELSGGASGTDYVYLFLTGPNLPSEGVSLDDIASGVETGAASTFTRASVKNNNIWNYKWDTKTAGGTPDAGNYLVYAVNTPSGRNDLSGKEYSYVQIIIKEPSVSAQTSTKAFETEAAVIPTVEMTPVLNTLSSDSSLVTESPVSSSESPQSTQASGFIGIVLIAVLISSVLLFRTEKR